MTIRRIVAAACAAALAGATAPALADPLPGWAAAMASGSDRLALYALERARPTGSEAYRANLARRLGALHPDGGGIVSLGQQADVWPILSWSRNFNGGVPGATIMIGDLEWTIDEADRARSGIVIGGGAGAVARFSYARGSVVTAGISASVSTLVGEGISRSEVGGSLCAAQHLRGFVWLDGCAALVGARQSGREDVVERSLSLTPVVVTHLGNVDQQISATLRRKMRNDYNQNSLSMDWTGAIPDVGALSLGGEGAKRVQGQNTVRRGLRAGLARPIAGRMTRVQASWYQTGGSTIFGTARTDRIVSLSAETVATPWLAVSATIGRRDSNFDTYDEMLGGVGFRWLRR
ncbi:MAG: hypothetical protein Q4G22_14065 [Paracoccus sp. (in: a-proteobacteria)]|uniref:hypothetical protein n=1 Tax=Paracoccus sp. TaxID=267 RepID=UPI0026DEC466|nr:hypothetical protein [Paracoccus sp. (in: a-proteobacteria)]MDO5632942.1 hypothetical protein [Paracoccus sp. (in: a-proteobacteria)]